MDGKKVGNPTEVQLAVDRGKVGKDLSVLVRRGDQSLNLTVRPAELSRDS